jgi:hypothetical protein
VRNPVEAPLRVETHVGRDVGRDGPAGSPGAAPERPASDHRAVASALHQLDWNGRTISP